MNKKSVIKVSFSEDLPQESNYFIKRLIEKIVIDNLELTPHLKGSLILNSKEIIDKEK